MKSSSYAAFSGVKDRSTRRATDTDDLSFAKAFKHFKDDGRKTFTWRGKKYSTKTKAEEAKRKPVMGSAKNIDPKALKGSGRPRKPVLGSSKNIAKSALKPVEKKPEKKARDLKTVVRPLPKMGSAKNVRGTKGTGGTKEVGKILTPRSGRIGETGKNIRGTKGKGGTKDFRTTGQMLKDLDFKDAFKDVMKRGKLRFSKGGSVDESAIIKKAVKDGKVKIGPKGRITRTPEFARKQSLQSDDFNARFRKGEKTMRKNKYSSGGPVGNGKKKADGIAIKGKTKCKMR